MSEIKNIADASAAVLKGQPRSVTLTNGRTVTVNRLNWVQFNEVYNELAGPLGGMFGSQAQGGQMLPGAAMMSASTLTAAITALVRATPSAVMKLAVNATGLTEEELGEFWVDVPLIGMEAFKLNFIEQDQLIGFFVGIGNVLSQLSPGLSLVGEEVPEPPTRKPRTKS